MPFGPPKACVALRESNRIVEGETKRFMNLFAAFSAIEEVGLDVMKDREQGTAGRVCCTAAVSTNDLTCAGGS
jgi:hypothetical protein